MYFSGGKTPDVGSRSYTEIMKEQLLRGEENEVSFEQIFWKNIFYYVNLIISCLQLRKKIVEKAKDGTLKISNGDASSKATAAATTKKRGRWDQGQDSDATAAKKKVVASTWDKEDVSE